MGLSSVVGVRRFESPALWLVELQAGSAKGFYLFEVEMTPSSSLVVERVTCVTFIMKILKIKHT